MFAFSHMLLDKSSCRRHSDPVALDLLIGSRTEDALEMTNHVHIKQFSQSLAICRKLVLSGDLLSALDMRLQQR